MANLMCMTNIVVINVHAQDIRDKNIVPHIIETVEAIKLKDEDIFILLVVRDADSSTRILQADIQLPLKPVLDLVNSCIQLKCLAALDKKSRVKETSTFKYIIE